MRILYVEDDPFDADLARRTLLKRAPDFRLDIAGTLGEARRRLAGGEPYDLLLTDLNLPDGSGMGLLAHVRERGLPMAVVVITGQGDEEVAVSVLKAGATDYVIKRQNYLEQLPAVLSRAYQRYQNETQRRARPLRLLYLESDPRSSEMTSLHFATHAQHINLTTVSTVRELLRLLEEGNECDVLLLSYYQQVVNILDVLKDLRQGHGVELPIILVASQGDEEIAVQALRLGVYDYVVKSPGYLYRLPGVVENAFHRWQLLREQEALRASEERFRRLAENAPDAIYRFRARPNLRLEYISPAIEAISGYPPETFYQAAEDFYRFVHSEDRPLLQSMFEGAPSKDTLTFRLKRPDGREAWVECRNVPLYDSEGVLVGHEGILRDISERKQAEERIQRQMERLKALRLIDLAITTNLDLSETLNILLDHLLAQLGVDAANLLLLGANEQTLIRRAAKGFHSPSLASTVTTEESIQAWCAIQQKTLVRAATETAERVSSQGKDAPAPWPALWREEGFVLYYGVPLMVENRVWGVLEVFHRSPFNPDAEWLDFLETVAGQAAIAIHNASLVEGLQQINRELLQAYDSTLQGWVQALDLRDKETEEHTRRVTEMTLRLARAMGVEESKLPHIQRGALLHDIGKMGIPDEILLKPGPLSQEEWDIMHRHPQYAHQLLSGIAYLREALEIPYYHHERWDGSGYPLGLKGEEIPLAARIFAVVDVWDALNSNRPYRKAWQPEEVLQYLRDQAGHQFDPKVVDTFLRLLKEDGLA